MVCRRCELYFNVVTSCKRRIQKYIGSLKLINQYNIYISTKNRTKPQQDKDEDKMVFHKKKIQVVLTFFVSEPCFQIRRLP